MESESMASIKLPGSRLQEYIQQYAISYCSDDEYVSPGKMIALLREHADIEASEYDVVEGLLALTKNWVRRGSYLGLRISNFHNGGVFFTLIIEE